MTVYYFPKKQYTCETCAVPISHTGRIRWCEECRKTERPKEAAVKGKKYARRRKAERERTAALALRRPA